MTELLDRSEDPARMIRMIIMEMEETLVDVRATAARSIADIKEMRRACERLDELQDSWAERAELALEKGREDLARAALVEKQKPPPTWPRGFMPRSAQIELVLKSYEADIARLQAKLAEARARQQAIVDRIEIAMTRARDQRNAARPPHRGRLRASKCSSAAPTSPRVMPRRWGWAGATWRQKSPSFAPPRRSTPNSKR